MQAGQGRQHAQRGSAPVSSMASLMPSPACSISTITRTSGISVRHSGGSSSCRAAWQQQEQGVKWHFFKRGLGTHR